ncbi:uncharacterized protein C8A04DRAFT_12340 [Dichotomopilus funicola]|uniref:TLDc domain-containing protein n=1 Tax=Dichotomopilus funicola TaxID=1934379 RepID=A0AAN6V3S4_9PEZI|nr:hypothetical protein C8A04DRAFT_12340 [Dichotomopilus funicola]
MANTVEEWCLRRIDQWLSRGLLKKEAVMERLDKAIQDSYAISEEDEATLNSVFRSVCTDEETLTEPLFLSLLQTKSALPRSLDGTAAGKRVYAALVYLSKLPFVPPTNAAHPDTTGLTLAQLKRALVWIFPDRDSSFIEEGSNSRMRTRADHRRRIFQSLASTMVADNVHTRIYDSQRARNLALRNAFEVEYEEHHEFCRPNHDDDGDEIYHDLIDLLCATQEVKHPGLATVPRDGFRSVGKAITAEHSLPRLYSLAFPAKEFVPLVKVLLALQFVPSAGGLDPSIDDPTGFKTAADALVAAFQEQDITYPAFDHALKHIAPFLLGPLYEILSVSFFNHSYPCLIAGALDLPPHLLKPPRNTMAPINPINETNPSREESASPDPFLKTPHLAQLVARFAENIDTGSLARVWAYDPCDHNHDHTQNGAPHDAPDVTITSIFLDALESAPDEAMVVIGGTRRERRQGEGNSEGIFGFGLFSSRPEDDGESIQPGESSRNSSNKQCALFQVTPVQDVFRGVVGRRGWARMESGDGVVFGGETGVVFRLRDELARFEVRHRQLQEGGGHDGINGHGEGCSFVPNPLRGNWRADFDVEMIEIWSEPE